ncbi:hypothetical protein BaRGS_00010542 [Batillaria attramentaria]|uniref:Uncharacterized protein n=1 Tax=Batillaria attramentaria TaxID=370345 RepID=A0ABD0LGU6_9CAEN
MPDNDLRMPGRGSQRTLVGEWLEEQISPKTSTTKGVRSTTSLLQRKAHAPIVTVFPLIALAPALTQRRQEEDGQNSRIRQN